MKKYIIVLLLFGCDDPIGPCYESEQQCKNLLKKMEAATTFEEKEHYRNRYLAERQLLEYCYSTQ